MAEGNPWTPSPWRSARQRRQAAPLMIGWRGMSPPCPRASATQRIALEQPNRVPGRQSPQPLPPAAAQSRAGSFSTVLQHTGTYAATSASVWVRRQTASSAATSSRWRFAPPLAHVAAATCVPLVPACPSTSSLPLERVTVKGGIQHGWKHIMFVKQSRGLHAFLGEGGGGVPQVRHGAEACTAGLHADVAN